MKQGGAEGAWTTNLGRGIDVVDFEHRALLARVARFIAAAEAGGRGEILDVLHFLGRYVEEHMRSEEAVMRARRYPGLDAHLREHESFRATFTALVNSSARHGNDARVAARVQRDVFDWLEAHIQTSDKALGDFVGPGVDVER